ncbi:exodeoxyribonuclease III [Indivirus ILV1]|uniref:Exodeoxyribonuclease III n=1 Tax=Indivirus ILV1 TaxID=1977633 RepID=A0A1V0SCG8_9VIRU|nr:exodeoxyribonuclease III [Indivirus ILV1]
MKSLFEPKMINIRRADENDFKSAEGLLTRYAKNNELLNKPVHVRNDNIFRLATYNVHYWSKISCCGDDKKKKEISNYNGILDIVREIDPDIICFQEVNYGKTKYITEDLNDALKNRNFKILSYCNTVPSWFDVPYGNAIAVNKRRTELYEDSHKKVPQKNKIYENYSGTTKCFIDIRIYGIRIICTHLDVHDNTGKVRMEQIRELNGYTNDGIPTIILGDFNLINVDDYNDDQTYLNDLQTAAKNREEYISTEEYKLIKSLGWIDSFDVKGDKPLYTVWNSSRVDYIFFKNFNRQQLNDLIMGSYVHFTSESDHIPVFVDLDLNLLKKIGGYTELKQEGGDVEREIDILPMAGSSRKKYDNYNRDYMKYIKYKAKYLKLKSTLGH